LAEAILVCIGKLAVADCKYLADMVVSHSVAQEVKNSELHCVSKKGPTLKRYSSKLYGSILIIFGRNIQKSLE